MVVILLSFLLWVAVCGSMNAEQCNFSNSTSLLIPISVLNFVTWLLLLVSTMSLRQILKKRFGDTYTFAQRKLVIYLSVFSLSFLLRGIFDAVQKTKTINTNTVWSAVEVFVIYFFCEWLPIFVIYLHHHEDFKNEIKQLQAQRTPFVENVQSNTAHISLLNSSQGSNQRIPSVSASSNNEGRWSSKSQSTDQRDSFN